MNKLYLLLVMLLGFFAEANAQFSSSETVYCYKYDYTSKDGIKSKNNSSSTYYFVNFQNNMMGFATANNIKTIRQNFIENSTYYEDAAKKDLADRYEGFKNKHYSGDMNSMYHGQVVNSTAILKYSANYSTSSKYTYRMYCKVGRKNAGFSSGLTFVWPSIVWEKEKWLSPCFSFSLDKSEMIVWSTSDSENRDYYKRINMSDLKPNTDFLY